MTPIIQHDLRTYIRNVDLLARLWRPSDRYSELKTRIFPYVMQGIGNYAPLANAKEVEEIIEAKVKDNDVLAERVRGAINYIKRQQFDLSCAPVILAANYWDPTENGQRKSQFAFRTESGRKGEDAKKAMMAAYIMAFALTELLYKESVYTLNTLIWERSVYHDPFLLTCAGGTGNQEPWIATVNPPNMDPHVWDDCLKAVESLKAFSVKKLEEMLERAVSPYVGDGSDEFQDLTRVPASRLIQGMKDMNLDSAVSLGVKKALEYAFGMKDIKEADIVATVRCADLLFHESGSRYLYCFPFTIDRQGCCTLNVFTRKRMIDDEILFFEMLTNAMFPRPMLRDFESELAALKMARRVQKLSLKKPPDDKIEKILWLSADCRPVGGQQIGGDFYFYARGRHGQQWIIIGDPTGHGIVAAMTMAKILTYCKALVQYHRSPSILLEEIDDLLRQDAISGGEAEHGKKAEEDRNYEEKIYTEVAMCAVVVDRPRKCFRIALAGDFPNPIYKKRLENASQRSIKHGKKLGDVKTGLDQTHDEDTGEIWSTYHEESIPFEDKDILLLFTDGALPNDDNDGAETGGDEIAKQDVHRLNALVDKYGDNLPKLVEKVIGNARGPTGEPTDDVAVFALRVDLSDHRK